MYNTFFGKFPKIQYNITNTLFGSKETVTNIFFRIGYVKKVLNELSSYYVYEVDDGDTPDNLADKVYGDSGANWMILYANDIMDPQYDWPLDYQSFNKYLFEKYKSQVKAATIDRVVITDGGHGYANATLTFDGGHGTGASANVRVDDAGSIVQISVDDAGSGYYLSDTVTANTDALETANSGGAVLNVKFADPSEADVFAYLQTTAHHYEKIITRTSDEDGIPIVTRFEIDKSIATNGLIHIGSNTGIITTGNVVYQGESLETATFSGDVISFTQSNGTLQLANTTGNILLHNELYVNNSNAVANVRTVFYDSTPYETYYNFVPENPPIVVNIDGYGVSEKTEAVMVSLFDYENEKNEAKRLIKIVKKEYYTGIQKEYNKLLEDYTDPTGNTMMSPISAGYTRRLI